MISDIAPPPPPPPCSSPPTASSPRSSTLSLKCLRCSCLGYVSYSDQTIQSSCHCLCCHSKDSNCIYCGIDKCIECNERYVLHFDDNKNYYFSCLKHCHHQKSAFSDNFNSLSRHRINRRIPPSYKTLLHSSVLAGDPDLTWDLLHKGANPFICDASGVTPIDLAKLLRTVKIQSTSKEKKIFDILPKISYPDSSVELPTDTRLRTQSDCGPEIPNTFMLSPKKPKMKKQHLRTEHSVLRQAKKKSPRRKSKTSSLSVTTDIPYRSQFEGSQFEPSNSPHYIPPPFTAPNPIRKKRSMTLTSSIQFPPETPRIHIHNNTFSKATSTMLSKKERAMTLTDHNEPTTIAHSSFGPLSYGNARRERAQTITDTSPKKKKIIKNGKIIFDPWDTNDLVSKRPLLRGLVQAGYRLAISNAPDLLRGKQVFTPLTLLKLSSDNNEISSDDFATPLSVPHQNHRHFQPTMSSVAEGETENEGQLETSEVSKQSQAPDEWIQWEISQFRDIIVNETEIEIPYSQRKTSSRTPSALTSRTGSYADFTNLDKDSTLSRNSSQNQLSNLTKTSKGSLSNKDISAMLPNDSLEPLRVSTPPVSGLQAPTPMRSHTTGVASRPNTSSPSISKARINLGNISSTMGATPPPLAPDASGDDVANAFAAFAQSMNTSTPPLLPKHLKTSRNMNTPPKSPAVVSEIDDKLKPKSPAVISDAEDRSNYDNSDSVDIGSSMEPQTVDDLLLTCTGCYDELPASQMVYTCSRMGCMSHLCQDCIFRSVFITITSALYAVPRIKCPGRCMHAIPTRIWRGILRGMKMSDEDKLTVHVEDQYPILRLLDLLYESFELFCGDYEDSCPSDHSKIDSNVEIKYVHMCDMLKKIETILIQDGYTLDELYNTVYEIREKESNESESDESDNDEDEDNDESNMKIIPDGTEKVHITSFAEFASLVYPRKNVTDSELEKSFLLMEDILNDSEIESNGLGVKKIRKLRLCIFLSHAAVIVRTRLNTALISSEYVGNYVMNIYHNDAESLLIKKYVHNANALLTIRCGGCDDTVSLYHTIENGKQLIFDKIEREKVLNKILSYLQSSSLSTSTNSSNILLFLRNWIHFITHRMPAVTFIANIIASYLNKISLEDEQGTTKVLTIESQLELGIIPPDLFKFLDLIISLILDVERRFAAQLEIYRKYPKIRVPCCDTKHCFLCKIQGHHKTKTCSEIQNTERGLNCQYCPGCGVATLRTEGCTEILCVCGAVWKWKLDEKKAGKGNEEEKETADKDELNGSEDDSEEDDEESGSSSESDSWDDDSSDESDDF